VRLLSSLVTKNNKKENPNKTSNDITAKPLFQYSYSIIPTNFANLSEVNQAEKLGKFFDVLRVIQRQIKITLSRRAMPITVEGQEVIMPVMQVHLESNEQLGDVLERLKFEYVSDIRPPHHEIVREHLGSLEIRTGYEKSDNAESLFAKCFTLYSLPASLPYAWVTGIFGICSEIQVWVRPVPNDESIIRMQRFKNVIYEDSRKERAIAELYQRADNTEMSLRRQETGLYECVINCMISDGNKKILNDLVKDFKKHIKLHGGHFAAVSAKQAAILQEGWGKRLTFDRGSCSILYGFVSADMLEIPNGIPLGINMDTKGPVIFDIAKRTNYNVAVIGKSGSGKSFTVKILLNRLKNKFPDSFTYIIDPQGEYGTISEYLEMNHLNITKSGEQLGLDPFVLLEPQDAADILGEITKAPATVRIQFQKYCDKAKNLEEFYYLLAPKSRIYLDHLLDGPLSRIFKKSDITRINDTKRLIVSMDGATGSDSEAMILVLLLNKIFKTCSLLPPSTRKIIVIDEAWMLFKMPGAAKYVDMIVRGGRKKNITFVFISQRIEDISKDDASGIGKIIDNIETKIMLGLEEQAAETARTVMNLSDQETAKLKSFNKGHALFLTKNHRIHAKFEPTMQEREMFDTTPLE